jgi:hypothetical protein
VVVVAVRAGDRGGWAARRPLARAATASARVVVIACHTRLGSLATSASALAAAQP